MMNDAIVFPPPHWTVEKLNEAVSRYDAISAKLRVPLSRVFPGDVVSLVDGWMMLDIGEGRVRIMTRSNLVFERDAESEMVDIILENDWLPDARRMLLIEAGFSPNGEGIVSAVPELIVHPSHPPDEETDAGE